MNASLAGLVGITASANIMSPWKAAIVGIVAAVVMRGHASRSSGCGSTTRSTRCRFISGPASGGRSPSVCSATWTRFRPASSRLEQIGIQLVGIGTCFVWAFGVGYVVLSLINRRFPFRIDAEGELAGLNIAEHGASTEIADLLSDMDEHHRSGRLRATRSGRAAHRGRPDRARVQPRAGRVRAPDRLAAAPPPHRRSGERVVIGRGRPGRGARRGVPLHRLADRTRVPRQPRRSRRPGLDGDLAPQRRERYSAFRAATEDEPIPPAAAFRASRSRRESRSSPPATT